MLLSSLVVEKTKKEAKKLDMAASLAAARYVLLARSSWMDGARICYTYTARTTTTTADEELHKAFLVRGKKGNGR